MTDIHKDKDGKCEPSSWQQGWHLPPFTLPTLDQKDLGLLIAQCGQPRLRVAQVLAGRARYSKISISKQRAEKAIQVPCVCLPDPRSRELCKPSQN